MVSRWSHVFFFFAFNHHSNLLLVLFQSSQVGFSTFHYINFKAKKPKSEKTSDVQSINGYSLFFLTFKRICILCVEFFFLHHLKRHLLLLAALFNRYEYFIYRLAWYSKWIIIDRPMNSKALFCTLIALRIFF